MKAHSLGRQPFLVNDTGYRIIFQKCLSITCEEMFKDWNRWMIGESTPPPFWYNSQKLGTSLWTWELISLLVCSRGNISITCSLPGADYNSVLDKMYFPKFRNIHITELLHTDAMPTLSISIVYQLKIPTDISSERHDIEETVLRFIDSARFWVVCNP